MHINKLNLHQTILNMTNIVFYLLWSLNIIAKQKQNIF